MAMKLIIHLESDWHVGTGAGIPGSIDRMVRRDPDGLPYLPAKSLTGMLRDAAEMVAAPLGWQDVVVSLFGGQPPTHGGAEDVAARPARLRVRPGRLPESVAGELRGDPDLRRALFFVQPGVSVDARTGRAHDKKLFFIEQVRGGAVLAADLTVEEDLELREKALLHAATLAVRRLGGGRRRGGGRCTLTLEGLGKPPNGDDWLSLLGAKRDAPASPAEDERWVDLPETSGGGDWTEVPLRLEARTPLLIGRATIGNVVEGLDYVPGSQLLPLVCSRLAGRLGSSGATALWGAVRAGDIVVTPAYPEVAAGEPGWPVPSSLAVPKGAAGLDRALDLVRAKRPDGEQFKGLREGWISFGEKPALLGRSELLTEATHNTVDDAVQRPTEKVGGVYTYQAIAQGTVLHAGLRLRKGLAKELAGKAEKWWKDLEGDASVGRSRKDDYGHVRIAAREPEPAAPRVGALVDDKYLVVWLLSDVLVRDERSSLSGDPRDLERELERALGLNLKPAPPNALGGELTLAVRAQRTESWQRSWQLPRPSLVGLRAGGVLVYELVDPGKWDAARATQVEGVGIGERRAEGFGRVWLNPPPFLGGDEPPAAPRTAKPQTAAEHASGPEGTQAFLELLREQAWRDKIRRAARAHAFGTSTKWLGVERSIWLRVSSSQIGNLRALSEAVKEDATVARQWLAHLHRVPNRAGRWPDEVLDAIRELFACPSRKTLIAETYEGEAHDVETRAVWAWLGLEQPPTELWPEAVRALLTAVAEAYFDEQERKRRTSRQPGAER